ncbi:UDP-3-O-(3-hydroxymyristoyl)glucosamine N-acyltransferase [Pelagibacterium halotolerans]|uniref:UDP-3-O-acylglucosamine N-acyltransferase n=1 Tax=Pelagibacterium halotolerans (strain DSM 22347 / JCM 15775 / CGMCC 1.7692 / B2) TaxID=1082931 RepID=G4R8U9_PELHB|nr:UDP-3-O-(3-hydroxymyristoyl)glucosamine N-acyltransferase [Pelagibacterium halotolerans]AEQ51366.1 UDP-3-O-(3-hydroxymyristoyl) glucosamine N-acyltransferase [Pelagibacterium halotolerans B2]QJR18791.1 UDP-3-O-(3-hydroxymyristoyl)glucosamine N-acyltransferase [Pelagibacterium halotolerans]SEA92902.1 UDP-3-O-[3-hydroxymyristoyl] glucosamine N-acyltransferase [Pelagibacterium halotolerans]
MIDPRFHESTGPQLLSDLLKAAGHKALSDSLRTDASIEGASDLADAGPTNLSFAASKSYADQLAHSGAGAVLVTADLAAAVAVHATAIVCEKPYDVFVDILNILYPDDGATVIRASTCIEPAALIEPGVTLGSNVSIGANAQVGSGTVIGANATIGAGVTIGRNCVIGSNVSIECAHLGNEVVIQPGVVIGAEGFGFQLRSDRHRKIPQLGRVIIQDRVELGANTTVDRGTLGDTVIGEGTKIDNLVQVGHNCRIGRNCVISGMCGLSGSTILEDGVVMGGGAGTAGHLTLGAGTLVLARSGVTHSFPAGSNIAGAPAQDVKMWKREIVAVRRLSKGDKT